MEKATTNRKAKPICKLSLFLKRYTNFTYAARHLRSCASAGDPALTKLTKQIAGQHDGKFFHVGADDEDE